MRGRTPLIVLGVLVFGAALGVFFVPNLGDAVPIDSAIEEAGSDYKLFTVFGAGALVVALVVFGLRAGGGQTQATPPNPETIRTAPAPGEQFDAVVEGGVGLRERLFGDRRETVRTRLGTAATRTVMRRENCGRETARSRVETGSWTTDPDAAAFVSNEDGPTPPPVSRVKAALRGESWFRRGARRTAEEIVRLEGER